MICDREAVFKAKISNPSPPIEKPNLQWDVWDYRWYRPKRQVIDYVRYPYPHGQIYPR